MTIGAVEAILVAVVLAILRFVTLVSRPRVEVLGRVEGLRGLHSIDHHAGARTVPGVLLLRFNGPIVFFNASYFKQQVLAAVAAASPGLRWVVVDMIPVTMVDVTGIHATRDLGAALAESGIGLAAAGRQTEWEQWFARRGLERSGAPHTFPSLSAAIEACRQDTETARGE